MTRDEALQKIKKCLALAASPEAHEAAAAMRQAQKLMQQFGLSETDVGLADVEEARTTARSVTLTDWEAALVNLVAEAFGCEVFTGKQHGWPMLGQRTARVFTFVGIGPAAEVAMYAYDVLSRQCAKGRKAHMAKQPRNCKTATKSARGDAYAMGWVAGVRAKLPAPTPSEKHEQLLRKYSETKYAQAKEEKAKDRTKGRNVADRDWLDGLEDGRRADFHQGLHGQTPQAQLTA